MAQEEIRPGRRSLGGAGDSLVADRDDLQLFFAARRSQSRQLTDPPTEERASKRRHEGHKSVRAIGFIHPDEAVGVLHPRLIAHGHLRAKAYLIARLGRRLDEHRGRHAGLKLSEARAGHGQARGALGVSAGQDLGISRGISLLRSVTMPSPRSLGVPLGELVAEERKTARGHVVLHARRQGRAGRHDDLRSCRIVAGKRFTHLRSIVRRWPPESAFPGSFRHFPPSA